MPEADNFADTRERDAKLKTVLESLGYPYAYDHITDPDTVPLPYVVYRYVATNSFAADGSLYYWGRGVDVELYAADPDDMQPLMNTVMNKLREAEIPFQVTADTVYIQDQDFYETLIEI